MTKGGSGQGPPRSGRATRAVTCAAILLLGASASGCLVSTLHPFYEAGSIAFAEELLGRWENRESNLTAAVSRGEWRSYHIAYTDQFGTTEYTGHLTEVGGSRFLNVRPADGEERQPLLLVTNAVVQIDLDGRQLRVRELDYAAALDRMKAGTLGLAAALDLRQNVVLTGEPAVLRKWLGANLSNAAMFAEWKTFTRSTP